MGLRSAKSAVIAIALSLVAACGQKQANSELAEPLPAPSYGEEAANPEVFLDSMEVGSRELYAARNAVVDAVGVQPGERVADIGAGTGLYSLLFAERTGPAGVVYAVDIEPRFLKLIAQRVADLDVSNVVAVLGREDDITLPPASVDIVFVADTYHYFDDREAIMNSVRESLSANGRLVVLDYTLDPSDIDDRRKDHVRFGKAGVVNEIESFGFELIDEPAVEGLDEIYMVIFKRAGA